MAVEIRPTGGDGVLQVIQTGSDPVEVDIVLIPGICTPEVETWPFCSPSWIDRCLPGQITRVRLLKFTYEVVLSDTFSWQEVWFHGEAFLEQLLKSRADIESSGQVRPILFVCHSLGGIILKQALCIANEQLHRYESLVNSVSGIIFISTPHFAHQSARKSIDILRATAKKKVKLSPERENEEGLILSDLSMRFEAIHLRAPALSIYESRETKIPGGRFKTKTVLLVDEKECTTHVLKEQFLPIPLDHISICQFHTDGEWSNLGVIEFVKSTLSNAHDDIKSRLESMQFRYATTTTYSPTSSTGELKEVDVRQTGDEIASPLTITRETGVATQGSSTADFEIVPIQATLGSLEVTPDEVTPEGPVAHLPCYMLNSTSQNPAFVGRDDVLRQLADALLPSRTKFVSSESEGLKQFALCGLGGVGKSEIAMEFALQHKDDFDAIFWMDSADEVKLDARYTQIAADLGLESTLDSTNQIVSRALVKGWLSSPKKYVEGQQERTTLSTDVNWLIIFDNADDPMILVDYWPQGSGSVLITSRDPLAKSLFSANLSGLDLEPLSEEYGSLLLTNITQETDEDYVAAQIVKKLGGLPLAIVQMGGVIRRQELQLSEFMETYSDESLHADLHQQNYRLGHGSYPFAISTVWAFDGLRPESNRLLYTLAFLDPDHIQEKYLIDHASSCIEGFPATVTAFNKARNELMQGSLIKRQRDKQEIRVHRLVQDAVKAQMSADNLKSLFWGTVELIQAQWPTGMGPPTSQSTVATPSQLHFVKRWPLCAALYPHVRRLKHLFKSIGPAVLGSPRLILARLLADAAQWQFERGRLQDFDDFWDIARDICSQTKEEGTDSLVVDIHFMLGVIGSESNNHAAGRMHKEKALELQKATSKALGVRDVRLARCHREFGAALIHFREYDKAIEEIGKSITIDKELGIYPSSWFCEINLGLAYVLKGDIVRADEVLTGTLERREAKFGKLDEVDIRSGRLLHAMGNLRAAQNREVESYRYHSDSLSVLLVTIGKNHYRTADLHHKVAQHLYRQQSYSEALTHLDEALATYSYGSTFRKCEIARSSFLKSKVLRAMDKGMKANVAFKQACSLRKEVAPTDNIPGAQLDEQDFDCLLTFWSQ